jgi:hypothetical protein
MRMSARWLPCILYSWRATGRYEAIKATARIAMDTRGQALVAAILSFAEIAEGYRNELAHGHWGVSDILPDTILWANGSDIIDLYIDKDRIKEEESHFVLWVDTDQLYYYRIKDFDGIIKTMKEVAYILSEFRMNITSSTQEGGERVFRPDDSLCAQVESYGPIRQALSRINGYALQPTPPKPPRLRKPPHHVRRTGAEADRIVACPDGDGLSMGICGA